MKPRIAIIGGGLSGMTCALALSERGFEVEVLEKEASAGGRMSSRRREGFSFDVGASWVADCYSTVGNLANHLGVRLESVGLVRHVVLRDGELNRIPAELQDESAYAFAETRVSREFADYVVDPFTSTMMFYRAHDLCAGAMLSLCGDYMNHPWLEGAARCGARVARAVEQRLAIHRPERVRAVEASA